MTDTSHAHRIAAALVTLHGEPKSYEDAVELVAVAYLRGALDRNLEINEELRDALNDSTAARIFRDMESTPL